MINLNEQQAKNLGLAVVELLSLKLSKSGFYNTSYGSKSLIGLGYTVQTIINQIVKG